MIESIRCIKCNSIMVLQRSSDADFILHSSRYHYKCSKTKCSNYCVKIFSPSITRSHEMNKQLISTKYHILQQLPVGDERMNDNNFDPEIADALNEHGAANANNSAQMENKVVLRGNDEMIERVKIEIEFDVNAIIKLTQYDIKLALTEMFEQIDLQEFNINQHPHKEQVTRMNNFKCQVWKQSL